VSSEVEAAFERLLATVPVETHAVLGTCSALLGVYQLVAESAKRHDIEVSLPTTARLDGGGCPLLQFTLFGLTHTIDVDHPLSGGDTWKMAWRCPHGRNVACEGVTFEVTFDGIIDTMQDGWTSQWYKCPTCDRDQS
jgi:hypothetical protein